MKTYNATIKFTFSGKQGTPEAVLRKALCSVLDNRFGEHIENIEVKQARSFARSTSKYSFSKKEV